LDPRLSLTFMHYMRKKLEEKKNIEQDIREVGQWHEIKERNVFPFLKSAKGSN
jgi:hypothetical protein